MKPTVSAGSRDTVRYRRPVIPPLRKARRGRCPGGPSGDGPAVPTRGRHERRDRPAVLRRRVLPRDPQGPAARGRSARPIERCSPRAHHPMRPVRRAARRSARRCLGALASLARARRVGSRCRTPASTCSTPTTAVVGARSRADRAVALLRLGRRSADRLRRRTRGARSTGITTLMREENMRAALLETRRCPSS